VTKLMPDLDALFGSKGESPLAGMFRFMPIEQTNAMIVITPQPEYLKQAEDWLRRLDRGGAENSVQLYVYNVKNLKAPDLADYLSQIFLGTSSGGSRRSSTSGSVGQGLRPVTIGGIGGRGGSAMSYQNSTRPQAKDEKATPAATPAASGSGGNKDSDIRISAIEENNQLMIMAQPVEWDQIEAAIKKLDVIPLQVQIEARILEVSLTGALQYGVQWWLGNLQSANGTYDNPRGPYPYPNAHDRHGALAGSVGPPSTCSGSSCTPATIFWSFINSKFQVQLSALETSGQAKSLSAPSLVVANNQEAQLSVGQQIPVQQISYTGLTGVNNNGTTGLSGLSSVQYLNTGVTLDVKPRVNPGGLVYLEISQEVSNPGPASAGTNPPINQRQIQTQVAVQSGQTVLLGGLIRDDQGDTDSGVPLLNRVPLLRNLFGSTNKTKNRTELIVLITPRVISSVDEAREMTADYARQFESLQPLRSSSPPPPVAAQPAPPERARTYPTHDDAKPQEDHPNDN